MGRSRLCSRWETRESEISFCSFGRLEPRADLHSTGHGNHGDYMFGWKGDALQRAIDARCGNDYCKELKRQTDEEAMKCAIPQTVEEDVEGDNCEYSAGLLR
jgi:hypothetical protein